MIDKTALYAELSFAEGKNISISNRFRINKKQYSKALFFRFSDTLKK